jgi:hypothetical protein
MELKALSALTNKGLLPAEPQIGADGKDYILLYIIRTYGPGGDGRNYSVALLGRRDEIGTQLWTATGKNPRTPENVTWPEILVWLTTPSKSKWRMWKVDATNTFADSRKLNHELYRSGK